jgi:hypothetical protein
MITVMDPVCQLMVATLMDRYLKKSYFGGKLLMVWQYTIANVLSAFECAL